MKKVRFLNDILKSERMKMQTQFDIELGSQDHLHYLHYSKKPDVFMPQAEKSFMMGTS